MFYKSSEEVERPSVIKLGPVNITMQELYVSCVTAAIVFPTTMFVTLVFRNSNTKHKKDNKVEPGLLKYVKVFISAYPKREALAFSQNQS